MEQLEGVAGQYEVQAAAMDRGTLDTRDTVRRAEAELASVRAEVARVVTNWTNTVISINKVDNQIMTIQIINSNCFHFALLISCFSLLLKVELLFIFAERRGTE